jgi:hypothetical protein
VVGFGQTSAATASTRPAVQVFQAFKHQSRSLKTKNPRSSLRADSEKASDSFRDNRSGRLLRAANRNNIANNHDHSSLNLIKVYRKNAE